ncbi:hypothetical protein [Endozoicomonas sp. SCSIO W0465]|uniref:hypothetical protein n=1 Tax=Endozoicomonas sp. SCSIO W0465 TaxID=2918516 RepID=UPI0020758C2D|nr:hypothetical protein [Endozoicomonas sp. SCSIO W0465]USE36166.1 hypothetical protein MJO57_29680 [Endozoicomonas sp. SCSIO W0465]
MNTNNSCVVQSDCRGDYSRSIPELTVKKDSAGSCHHDGYRVSVQTNQNIQLSAQGVVRHEKCSGLQDFEICKHDTQDRSDSLYQCAMADRADRLEHLYHPPVHLTFERDDINDSSVGCLNFEKLLKFHIDILSTRAGCGISCRLAISTDRPTKARVEVQSEELKTIITFTNDYGSETKLTLDNNYWLYHDYEKLLERYKSLNLLECSGGK